MIYYCRTLRRWLRSRLPDVRAKLAARAAASAAGGADDAEMHAASTLGSRCCSETDAAAPPAQRLRLAADVSPMAASSETPSPTPTPPQMPATVDYVVAVDDPSGVPQSDAVVFAAITEYASPHAATIVDIAGKSAAWVTVEEDASSAFMPCYAMPDGGVYVAELPCAHGRPALRLHIAEPNTEGSDRLIAAAEQLRQLTKPPKASRKARGRHP